MGFRKDAYATVWGIEDKGNYHEVKLSIQKKDKQSGEYKQDFNGFVRFIGTAHTLCKDENIQVKDRIKLGNVDVTNNYDKEKKITYTNFLCFSFDTMQEQNSGNAESAYAKLEEDSDEPF